MNCLVSQQLAWTIQMSLFQTIPLKKVQIENLLCLLLVERAWLASPNFLQKNPNSEFCLHQSLDVAMFLQGSSEIHPDFPGSLSAHLFLLH